MDELAYVYVTACLIVGYFVIKVATKTFDPFAPVWLFLVGYAQVYVVQAISYHDYGIRARGLDVVTTANSRALWAIAWFLFVYEFGFGRSIAAKWPKAPERWSLGMVGVLSPIMFVWGLACGIFVARLLAMQASVADVSAESFILLQFPIMMLVAGVLLVVTGRNFERPRPALTAIGLMICLSYVALWMFNTKRSHSLLGVLATVCAYYTPRYKRPSFPVLFATALAGALAVGVSIGWRADRKHERSVFGFVEYVTEFDPWKVLASLNIEVDDPDAPALAKSVASKETEEWGGYLLMLDTVPAKSEHDFGASYIRIVSTFIPRVVWPDKPFYGRDAWISAWMAGSEFKRKPDFTGPAIGILGATHLNGGAPATFIVMGLLGLLLRSAYEYFLRFAHTPWAQAWWALTFYNAWFMTVNDDPFVWFYYSYGFMLLPAFVLLWVYNRMSGAGEAPLRVGPPGRVELQD